MVSAFLLGPLRRIEGTGSSKENSKTLSIRVRFGTIFEGGWSVVIPAMMSMLTVLSISCTLYLKILLLFSAGLILTLFQPFDDHPNSHGSLAPAKKPSKFH